MSVIFFSRTPVLAMMFWALERIWTDQHCRLEVTTSLKIRPLFEHKHHSYNQFLRPGCNKELTLYEKIASPVYNPMFMPLCLLVIGKHLHGDKEARQTHPATSNNVVLLGHVTEWGQMIENAPLKASASSLLPAYASKQNQTLHCMSLSPIHGKHQQIRTHTWWHTATQATHTPCYRFFLKITPCYCFNGKLNTILLVLY